MQAPRFESGGLLSQDPAISYVRSEKSLNDDQRRSIHRVTSWLEVYCFLYLVVGWLTYYKFCLSIHLILV